MFNDYLGQESSTHMANLVIITSVKEVGTGQSNEEVERSLIACV
jgi:hypothetical protein